MAGIWRSRLINAVLAVLQRPRAGAGARSRLLQLFSTSVVDQIMLSAGNFFVGFMLIRRTSDADYGMFVLVQSAILLLVSGQNAWLSGPLAVLAPKRPPDQRRAMVGAVAGSQIRLLVWATAASLLVPLAGLLLGRLTTLVAAVAAVGILAAAASLQREYVRSVLFVYSRSNDVFVSDAFYVAALLVGALLAAFGPAPRVLWAVAGVLAAAWCGGAVAHRSLGRNPGWVGGDARPYWREMRPLGIWSALGAVIYWSFGQSYNYMLASRVNLTAVADVNAARLLLMPAFVVALGIKSLLIPSAASWLAESGLARLVKRLAVFAAGIVVLDLMYVACVWLLRDWMTDDLLHKHIGDRDALLLLWASIAIIGLVRDVLQCALIALESFRPMAWLTGLSAVISLSLTWFGLAWWGPRAALIGVISGECVNLLGVLWLLRRRLAASRAAPARAPDAPA
jgi:O-antigen/teichoic acid export membrane protein